MRSKAGATGAAASVVKRWRAVPNESGLWWWWNKDRDGNPIHVNVMHSGTGNSFFCPPNQWGWTEYQDCATMGGRWLKAYEPSIEEFL